MSPRKHDEIADSLTRDILVGQYRTGERLPSERDLAARFDANRGAVREAMKKLEQLGIATIAPGGARVAPLQEASLDIIGPLLALNDVPDEALVDQIMQVLGNLMILAAESAVQRASAAGIEEIRAKVQPLMAVCSDRESHAAARFALMQTIMQASGNLVCQLIARALLVQFAPRMAPLEGVVELNLDAHRIHARQLDRALADRDVPAVRAIFESMSRYNRDAARQAFAVIKERRAPRPGQEAAS